ncbi:hypothetical protein Tco_0971419 [Tanacetum coccineum]
MAQQIILAAQLVPKFQGIRRCNNYVVLQSIPCSPECKIIGQILLDHPLIYALTVHCMHVLACNLTIIHSAHTRGTSPQVPDTKATIKFKLDSQEITYTVDMFHDALKLPVGTPNNPFITPVNIKVIKSFKQMAGYQGVVDKVGTFYTKFLAQPWQTMFKKKDVITYPRFTKLVIADLMKKNALFQGMPIPDAFLTDEIRVTNDYTKYETVFMKLEVPMNRPQPVVSILRNVYDDTRAHKTPTLTAASPQGKKMKQSARETSSPRKSLKVTIKQKAKNTSIPPPSDDRERDEITEATLLSLTLHKTALVAEAQENVAKVQEKLAEEEIENMVEGEENEESYASEFADSMRNEDVNDSGTRIEPRHKENPKVVDDDDVTKKKDDKKDEDEEESDAC